MAGNREFDLCVVGAGPGGYVAAIRAAQLGMKVALVEERERLGGTCLNIGCIPSKALLDSSEKLWNCQHDLGDHGIHIGDLSFDLAKLMKRKDAVVEKLTSGIDGLMKKHGVTVFHGRGSVETAGVVTVDGAESGRIAATSIILATGSESQELPFLPFDGDSIVSSTEALSLDAVPGKLLIVGAGAIGLELGSVWARLGSEVTVVEIMANILPGWDLQISRMLKKELAKQGLVFRLSTKVTGFEKTESGISLTAETASGEVETLSGDKVLVAVGRRPRLGGDIDKLGLKREGPGLAVDSRFQTSLAGVYAIGDLIAGPMLAHKAEEEGIACVELLAGQGGHVNYDTVPNVVYTWPEAAAVGKTEEQLKAAGVKYRKGSFPFRANGRALASGYSEGFVKILADHETDAVLGAHIMGPQASALVAEVVAVMEFGGSAEDIARTVHAHPTLPESVKEAALAVDGRSIHGG